MTVFGLARRWWALAGGVALVLAGVLVWVLWPSGGTAPRARQYRDFDACLLTDGQGLAGEPVRPVWSGMQDASSSTRVRVSYLSVVGESTSSNALPYLASLVRRRCRVVVAVGQAQVAAVNVDASRFPEVRFVAVGAGAVSGTNVTVVDASSADGVRAAVRQLVVTAAGTGTH